ncbi:MAG: nitrogen fixation protein [Cyanobacteria bacterium J06632_3]
MLNCPSSQPNAENNLVFGLVCGTADQPRVRYLQTPRPFTQALREKISPLSPTAVLRITSPCAQSDCQHFHNQQCRLIDQLIEALPPVTDPLPPCKIRHQCRWWHQAGKAACQRCPQIVTTVRTARP